MALYTVTTGNTILAADVNQLENVLQRSSCQIEAGAYFMAGGVYTNTAYVSSYVASLSRISTPVSVSLDTSIQAPAGNISSVTANNLTFGGFQCFAQCSAANTNARAGGLYTIQF